MVAGESYRGEESPLCRAASATASPRTRDPSARCGGIEPGTSEIARRIAGEDLNLALFEGLKSRGNRDLHITSANFDEPRCVGIVECSDFVLAIHGEENDQNAIVYIGGRDQTLRQAVVEELRQACFDVQEHSDPDLQGVHPNNICNRGTRGCGVQLELTKKLRGTFFPSLARSDRQDPKPDFYRFVAAVRRGLQRGGAL